MSVGFLLIVYLYFRRLHFFKTCLWTCTCVYISNLPAVLLHQCYQILMSSYPNCKQFRVLSFYLHLSGIVAKFKECLLISNLYKSIICFLLTSANFYIKLAKLELPVKLIKYPCNMHVCLCTHKCPHTHACILTWVRADNSADCILSHTTSMPGTSTPDFSHA